MHLLTAFINIVGVILQLNKMMTLRQILTRMGQAKVIILDFYIFLTDFTDRIAVGNAYDILVSCVCAFLLFFTATNYVLSLQTLLFFTARCSVISADYAMERCPSVCPFICHMSVSCVKMAKQ